MDSRKESNSYRVVMLPWLAHGHISPFLELAKRLTKHKFDIYFCSTPINLQHIKKNLAHKYPLSIQLVELNLPYSPDLPPHYHTTNGLPLHLNKLLMELYEKSAPNFTTILENLSPHLLIYDFNQWWAAHAASSLNIPSVQFLTLSAVSTSVVHHCFNKPLSEQYPFPEINLTYNEVKRLKEAFGVSLEDSKNIHPGLKSMDSSCGIILIKTTKELEGKYIDYLSRNLEKEVLPIGPLLQDSSPEEDGHEEYAEIFQWLDKMDESSVVFISFGSECFLSNNEIEELAYGLELSKVSFIWVIRFQRGNNTSIEQILPRGFLERIGERGLVIEKWAPQDKILSHSSIGGFISHCGWGSVMESICYGVPIIAMPMQYDQPYNARLVVAIGVGIIVGKEGDGRLKREEMTEAVKKVVEEEEGVKLREKVVELSEIMRNKGDQDIDKVVMENLVKLCDQKN